MRYLLIKLFLLLVMLNNTSAQQNDKSDFAFAKYLFETGQYELASLELERQLFRNVQDFEVRMLLIKTYRFADRHLAARKLADTPLPHTTINQQFELWQAYINSCLYLKDFVAIRNSLAQHTSFRSLTPYESYKQNLESGLNLLEATKNQKLQLPAMGTDAFLVQQFEIWNNSKRKSPVLAAGFSTLLPGSGKVYAGAWKDGLIAFLFVGANAYSSYRGFSNQGIRSPYGWIFGSLTAGFYLGNIYGSHRQARKHNHLLEKSIKDRAYNRLLDLHP
ncbi:MAG: hypothetical protein ACK417_06755 [Bacteroidia bacterium]